VPAEAADETSGEIEMNASDENADDGRETMEIARPRESEARDASGAAPRYSRRLSDKVLIAFHHACDQEDFDIAQELLGILEKILTRRPVAPDGNRRRSMESLVAAHERLWHLRHPGENQF
jgi:hypothetical protein